MAEEVEEVAVHDGADLVVLVTARLQEGDNFLKVGDASEVLGCLLETETAVEVGTDADVVSVAG